MIKGIQRAVRYIEDNILEDLDVDKIAAEAYVSPFYFQRLFLMLSGMTLGTYIRNRRLSLAAVELQSSDSKIIDIAMKYGYDTPESFSRAFERFHSVLPSAARARGTKVNSLSPLSIKVSLEGGSVLTYSVEEVKGFKILAKTVRFGDGYEAITELWNQCLADGTIKELIAYSTSPNKELIGLNDGSAFDGETGLYYLGTIYDKDTVPEGYVIKEVPARTWIKFLCGELTDRSEDAEIWKRIYSGYFPTSEYIPDIYQIVMYPMADKSNSAEMGEIWVDVKKQNYTGN